MCISFLYNFIIKNKNFVVLIFKNCTAHTSTDRCVHAVLCALTFTNIPSYSMIGEVYDAVLLYRKDIYTKIVFILSLNQIQNKATRERSYIYSYRCLFIYYVDIYPKFVFH